MLVHSMAASTLVYIVSAQQFASRKVLWHAGLYYLVQSELGYFDCAYC